MSSVPVPTSKDSRNWLIHKLYLRQDYEKCLVLIEELLSEFNQLCEYPLFVKALILRHKGDIQGSLELFRKATALNPRNIVNLKQVARSLYLLGKHRTAIDVYFEAEDIDTEDWEIHHNKGLCFAALKKYDEALDCFSTANSIQRHDVTYTEMGRLYLLMGDVKQGIATLTEGIKFSPSNADLLTELGLCHLRNGDSNKAFELLGSALTINPRNPKTVLAAASIIQDHGDTDAALIKYRIVAAASPVNPQLWNNVGMCYFAKSKYNVAIACLKRALYLSPFEWLISYNLGLAHIHTQQYASAFHFLSAAINLKPDYAPAFMYLALVLAHLDDIHNATMFFDKAVRMDRANPVTYINFAVALVAHGDKAKAAEKLALFVQKTEDACPAVNKQVLADCYDAYKAVCAALDQELKLKPPMHTSGTL
eukprot:GCRY01002950.1.p1 GENE.GCRY01002950.1~~GCRY01002950.1.p1  ORF type:complete len:423 (-),score=76.06 GCRY01002950.1:369-1637(-)